MSYEPMRKLYMYVNSANVDISLEYVCACVYDTEIPTIIDPSATKKIPQRYGVNNCGNLSIYTHHGHCACICIHIPQIYAHLRLFIPALFRNLLIYLKLICMLQINQNVCMFVYMYVCLIVCMFVRMYVCMLACLHVCMYVCMYLCMYVCMYADINFIQTCTNIIYTYRYTQTYTYTHIHVHAYIHAYIYAYIHTYICTSRSFCPSCTARFENRIGPLNYK